MLGCSTTLVLEMPRLGSWLDCAWLQYNFSTGNASFRVLAGPKLPKNVIGFFFLSSFFPSKIKDCYRGAGQESTARRGVILQPQLELMHRMIHLIS